MSDVQPTADGGKATVRQVYELMGEFRREVGDKLDTVSDRIDAFLADTQHRLSVTETHVANHQTRITKVESDVDLLRIAHAEAQGRITLAKAIIGLLASLCCGLVADVVIRWFH